MALKGAAWGWKRLWTLSSYRRDVEAGRVEWEGLRFCGEGRCRIWEAKNSSMDRLAATVTSV